MSEINKLKVIAGNFTKLLMFVLTLYVRYFTKYLGTYRQTYRQFYFVTQKTDIAIVAVSQDKTFL